MTPIPKNWLMVIFYRWSREFHDIILTFVGPIQSREKAKQSYPGVWRCHLYVKNSHLSFPSMFQSIPWPNKFLPNKSPFPWPPSPSENSCHLFFVEAHGGAEEEEKDKVDDPNGPRWSELFSPWIHRKGGTPKRVPKKKTKINNNGYQVMGSGNLKIRMQQLTAVTIPNTPSTIGM